ncbi:MAG: CPBP family intramembrane metalloprotease [Saprospiraceae bacterium]|nr:CPBP family intramembrane metalloprotease [Saprospiraceae bacterium]
MNPFGQPLLRYFGIWMLGGVVLFYFLVRLAAGTGLDIDATSGGILLQLLALLPLIWLVWKHWNNQLGIHYFFNQNHQPFRWLELGLLLTVIIMISYSIEGLTLILISWWSPAYAVDLLEQPIFPSGLPWSIDILNLILVVVVGPLMEEFVFRGLILQRLMVKYGTSTAIVISSILFGVLHFETWLTASVFGLIMCVLFLGSRNLWLPISIHMANNAMAVCINVWQHNQEEPLTINQIIVQQWYYILALSVTPIIIYFVKKYWPVGDSELPYAMNLKHAK